MTREELLSTHPDYDANIGEWQFFMRSYFGGRIYHEGDYLLQHPFESAGNYKRRKDIAYYYNYCGPIIDIMVSHLFRKPPKRDYGSFTDDRLFRSFLNDADLEGLSFNQFMRDAQRFASIYGRVSIIIDKPVVVPGTRAVAEDYDIRPYLSLITPENLVDWNYIRLPSGRPVLDSVKVREDSLTYRIWNRESWELWRIGAAGSDNDGDAVLIDSGVHGLGIVPIVNLYNKRSGVRMVGASDIQDIADINKNIYYLCSDAKEIIENTAFPMLAIPYENAASSASDGDREIGPRNILQFDPSEPGARPYWLEAPHSSLSEIRKWVRQDITEIHRIAKMGGVKSTEDYSQARSGVAIELEYQQLHSMLSEKADNIEQVESQLLNLFGMWQGVSFDGYVDYPDDFSVRELDRDIERAIKALSVGVESRTFKREVEKSIVGAVLTKLDGNKKREIDEEIDNG
ncbi:MAG: phage portal protein [Deltaproteobacteria bacterium]|nr:phage portal protein [Deltaproteobacteria bacterium]